MAIPDEEAIEMFISITGASESIAVRKLLEHSGDLNQAVNAHFSEGDRNISRVTSIAEDEDDAMDIDEPAQDESFPVVPPARTMNSFSLLESGLSRSAFGINTDSSSTNQLVSHPREVREMPAVPNDGSEQLGHSVLGATIEDSTGTANQQSPDFHDTVLIDENGEEDILATHATRGSPTYAHVAASRPSAPRIDASPDYRDDIEEQMVQAAIEASKRDSKFNLSNQNTSMPAGPAQGQSFLEDPQIAQAVSLSLKTVEHEKAVRSLEEKVGPSELEDLKSSEMEDAGRSANGRLEVGGLSTQAESEDIEEQPLVRHRSRQLSPGSVDSDTETKETNVNPSSSPEYDTGTGDPEHNETGVRLDEWGGISSLEHDEAVMLEAALFGRIPEGSAYHVPYAPHQFMQNGLDGMGGYPLRVPRPPSPSLTAQRLLREQQDDEYLASLQADREKELKAREEAEIRRLEEQAAREAALKKERQKEEELHRKLQEEQEMEKQLAEKEASLPLEPSPDDINAVTLLIRMPDGSRRGRRFLKSHKLQYLFDFIDVGRQVKPASYRLVRPYPRRTFGDEERGVTFNDIGLNSRQEALFLEFI